jgi:hypothetical protein
MKEFLKAAAICLLVLIGTASRSPCASPDLAYPSIEIISSLVPTLEVLSDSCFVFDVPRTNPYYFGPLRKGEKVKRLDVQDAWTHVWIPRLRISGWVKSGQVYETEQKDPEPITIPVKLFTRVVVTTKTANVRSEARAQAQVLLIARLNQEFWLLNEKGGWYLVWLSELNQAGWVFGKIVSKQKKE